MNLKFLIRLNNQFDIALFVNIFIKNNKPAITKIVKLVQLIDDSCFVFVLDNFTILISLYVFLNSSLTLNPCSLVFILIPKKLNIFKNNFVNKPNSFFNAGITLPNKNKTNTNIIVVIILIIISLCYSVTNVTSCKLFSLCYFFFYWFIYLFIIIYAIMYS